MTIGFNTVGIKKESKNDSHEVKSFEIIRFVEYGGQCYPEADCVTGELLVFRLKRRPEIEQAILLGWIRQLARQMELLYQSCGTRGYRYLNPYSVLITPEEKVFLLDLDAEGNAFVLRSMQKRVIRNNFIKADNDGKRGAPVRQDLFGFGRTVQFILANVTVCPRLSRLQERRMEQLIKQCTEKGHRKRCEDFSRIQKAIPSKCAARFSVNKDRMRILGIVLFFCICMMVLFSRFLAEQARAAELENQLEEYKSGAEAQRTEQSFTETTGTKAAEAERSNTEEYSIEKLKQLLLNNNADDNMEVIERGEELHCEVIQCLASAYDREDMKDKALAAYEELSVMEAEDELIEWAYSRRIALEEEKNNGDDALEVAEKAAESLPDSQKIALLYLKMLYRYGRETEEEYREKEKEILAVFPELAKSEEYQLFTTEKEEVSE